MEDFVRFNINAAIGSIWYLAFILIIFLILKEGVPKKYKRRMNWFVAAACIIGVIAIFCSSLSQLSTNQLPKSKIDRSYTNQSQSEYERRVKNNSREEK